MISCGALLALKLFRFFENDASVKTALDLEPSVEFVSPRARLCFISPFAVDVAPE